MERKYRKLLNRKNPFDKLVIKEIENGNLIVDVVGIKKCGMGCS